LICGLRVDVDTLRGTRKGVPALVETMAARGVQASFFFSVGPDNMGRHLKRLLRPAFLLKMLRTRAPSLYGWDILLRGTLLPGPIIGRRCAGVIRAVADAGHEVGLHAWDHHAWQARVERMDGPEAERHMRRGAELLAEVLGEPTTCSAAPAWRCTDAVLVEKRRFPFRYNSDCRGRAPFAPRLADGSLGQPQLPTTLPTFDERVGRDATAERYYDDLLEQMEPDGFNVLTIHAEVEGIYSRDLFAAFLDRAVGRGWRFVPLGELLPPAAALGEASMVRGEVAGREGWVSCQAGA
jgi:undecaprenyl phosphate-alpha-L-ara4FN deformylase